MTAPIRRRQNDRHALDLLAAQRALYREVKILRRLRHALIAAGAVTGAALSLTIARDPVQAGMITGGGLLLLSLVTGARERHRQATAAAVQEEFDTYVYPLPWNDLLADRPPTALVASAAARFRQRHGDAGLTDWYPKLTGADQPTAILLCQRVNVSWTAPLHRQWAAVLGGTLAVLVGAAGAVVLTGTLTATEFAAGVAAPLLAPAHNLIEALRANLDHARRAARLHTEIMRIWREATDGRAAVHPAQCRQIQDQLHQLRAAGPLVPDLLYRIRRRPTHRIVQAQNQHLTARAGGTNP